MSRHQASRRRTYGRRQHELHERHDETIEWPNDGPDPPRGDITPAEEHRPQPLGDLLGHAPWRWVTGRG
jgi:hypothetical protein